jgi:anthranilate/para-aminobenzoate synthase component I
VLLSRSLDVTGDPFDLVQPLLGEPGAFLAGDEGHWVFGCWPAARSTALDPEPQLGLRPGLSTAPRWFGLLPYEAFRGAERSRQAEQREAPLASQVSWCRYGAVALFGPAGARVEGDDPAAVAALWTALTSSRDSRGPSRVRLDLLEPVESAEVHGGRVRRALEHIAAGDLYQVNLARRFDFRASGHPIELLRALGALARTPFASAGEFDGLGWVSASPELFLELTATGRLTTRPIKGTRPRGATPAEDARLRCELDESEKERAELAMIVDVERNDFGRVSVVGSVRLAEAPHVVSHATVHHREATVTAQLRPDVSRGELLVATMPSGSVTGAPKLRAMELIADLEAARRGLYTGALGVLGHDGSLRLSMAIRVLTLRDERAHYFAGGGIVADSDPGAEVEETLWKARQLAALVPTLGW